MRPHELSDLSTRLTALILPAAILAAAGCGTDGNGGLDGDDDDPSPQLPAVVHVGAGADLDVAIADGDTVQAGFSLAGSWFPSADSVSLEQGEVEGDSGPSRFGPYRISLDSPLLWAAGAYPEAGSWTLAAGARSLAAQVVPDADGSGSPGVTVTYFDSGLPSGDTTLVWVDLLFPDPAAPSWVADAAFGFRLLALTEAHLRIVLVDLAFGVAHDVELTSAGASGITANGPGYPGGIQPSTLVCLWEDANHSGTLGPGDAFRFSRTDWWSSGPGPERGELLAGEWSLEGYIENRDPVISVGGAMMFPRFYWSEARELDGGWFRTGRDVSTTGSGNLFVHQHP